MYNVSSAFVIACVVPYKCCIVCGMFSGRGIPSFYFFRAVSQTAGGMVAIRGALGMQRRGCLTPRLFKTMHAFDYALVVSYACLQVVLELFIKSFALNCNLV